MRVGYSGKYKMEGSKIILTCDQDTSKVGEAKPCSKSFEGDAIDEKTIQLAIPDLADSYNRLVLAPQSQSPKGNNPFGLKRQRQKHIGYVVSSGEGPEPQTE